MTTNELIIALKEADPSGKLDVTLGKEPIHFVECMPAYYDGCLQRLVHSKNKEPYYDIVGAIYTDKGNHVNIHGLSIQDAIYENEDLPVSFLISESRDGYYKEKVENWRKHSHDVEYETHRYMEKLKEKEKSDVKV